MLKELLPETIADYQEAYGLWKELSQATFAFLKSKKVDFRLNQAYLKDLSKHLFRRPLIAYKGVPIPDLEVIQTAAAAFLSQQRKCSAADVFLIHTAYLRAQEKALAELVNVYDSAINRLIRQKCALSKLKIKSGDLQFQEIQLAVYQRLLQSLKSFDHQHHSGARFFTYAKQAIDAEITQALSQIQQQFINHSAEDLKDIQALNKLALFPGASADSQAELMGWSREKLEHVKQIRASSSLRSLDAPAYADPEANRTLLDTIDAEYSPPDTNLNPESVMGLIKQHYPDQEDQALLLLLLGERDQASVLKQLQIDISELERRQQALIAKLGQDQVFIDELSLRSPLR